jgi:hypothetical protein
MMTMEGKMSKVLLQMSIALAVFAAGLSVVAVLEVHGAQEHRAEQAPLRVTLYEGRHCQQVNGEITDVVTADDADWLLQHCSGGVTWKELRRE